MILSGKRALNSPVNNGQIPGVQTPLTAKKKIKTKKEGKKEVVVVTAAATQASASASALASALNHSRKLSDNRLCQLGIASGFSPDRIYGERHISNNSPNSNSLARKDGQNYEMRSYVYQQQEQKQSHGGDGEEGERYFHQSYEGNQDIKNKLISLLTSKNESKKLVSSKSSGNSLDFAVGEFGRRKKSPQNVENNQNINFQQTGSYAHHQSQQYLSKKSPSSNSKNLLYFQEKPLGLTNSNSKTQQIHSGSSTHYALSPKEPKNIQTILQQAHERSTREKQLYSFSPHLNALLKSKKLSPEKRESLSPEQEHLTKIIVQQKSSSSNISALNSRSGVSPSAAENKQQQYLSAAAVPSVLKKKPSTAKAQVGYLLNGGNTRISNPSHVESQKHDNSKERIINLLNSKQEGHCSPLNQPLPSKEYNTRKNSTVSKKPKSVSPEGQQSSSATAKGVLNRTAKKGSPSSRPLTNQYHQTQTKKAFFKKLRPPELEEVPSANTISQSVPNSSKNNLSQHPPFHTPSHIGNGQRDQQQKKFYFDSGSVSSKNSQLLHSHTVNTTSLQAGNTFNLHHSQLNPNNQSASAVNHSNSARSSNHPVAANPFYQNYLYQFLHGAEQFTPNSNQLNNHVPSPSNNSQNNLNVLNSSLKNAENKLMKIQEDMQEGEQSNGSQQFSERLQKTFLRTSKLLTGYKTRELNWEHEKRALVDEIKFLKNLLYTEQFDDIIKDGD